jgi:hypothetical protein
MINPAPPPGTNLGDGAIGADQPTPGTVGPPATAVVPALAHAEFAAAVKDALRDAHSPDLLARSPCCATESVISAGQPGRGS